jgi:hypothetical protein
MQEGGGTKLSTTLLSIAAIVLFVGGSAISLLQPSDALTSNSQDTVMTSTTQECEYCCYYFE